MKSSTPHTRFPARIPLRHPTREVRIGDLRIGANHPILIQSMIIADTCDTEAAVAEIRQLAEAGCPLIRVTAPSIKDAENLGEIKKRLRADSVDVPLVADIHFTPNAAIEAARHVEKVRINPGNYADRKRFQVFEVSEDAYREGLEKLRYRFLPLVHVLREEGRALRIGTNHGSLSDRILNRFGDTPEGMVESALEFVRICRDEGFHDIVLSMKSSIPSVMIAAYRLLVQRMDAEGMDYPLHVGVTEAGDGIEGRIKSATGIGSLLIAGIGDTIRVSLTEDSIHELAACRNVLEAVRAEQGRAATDARPFETPSSGSAAGDVVRPAADASTDGRDASTDGRDASTDGRAASTDGRDASTDGRDASTDGRDATTDRRDAAFVHSPIWHDLPITTSAERRESREWRLGRWPLGGGHRIAVELRVPLPLDGELSPEWRERISRAGRDGGPEIVSFLPVGGCRLGTPNESPDAKGGSWVEHLEGIRRELGIVPLIYEHRGRVPDDACLARLRGVADGISLRIPLESDGSLDVGATLRVARTASFAGLGIRWRVPPGASADIALASSNLARESDLPAGAFACEPGPHWAGRTRALAEALPADPIFLEVPALGASAPSLAGSLLLDGIGDAICLVEPEPSSPKTTGSAGSAGPAAPALATSPWPKGGVSWTEDPLVSAYHILQACRIRLTRPEFIACPSCGRTQFDLQTTTARIRARTGHLRGVKLAIMGCIVNGPGEMADADFGYVGSGAGRIDLYVGKERVEKNIPEAEAEDRLVSLLRDHGAWADPV